MIVPLVSMRKVVPHTGTWIETVPDGEKLPLQKSCPTRARGLKLLQLLDYFGYLCRAPHGHVD